MLTTRLQRHLLNLERITFSNKQLGMIVYTKLKMKMELENFRNKRKTCLKYRLNEFATISNKNKNIRDVYRGINEFKRGCHPEVP
jgi:hypothetical protein